MGAQVAMHDPYVRQLNVNGQLIVSVDFSSIKSTRYDCIVLSVAHSCYKNYKEYYASSVFDLTNTVDKGVSNLSII
jgi:UDP-N-acetyl-D-mannosaminuronate dehydrogenase